MKGFFDQLFILFVYGSILLALFVALLLNSKRVRRSRANFFLSILLLALAFSVSHIFFAGKVITHFDIKTFQAGDPTFLLISPFLWFYTQELTGTRVNFTGKSLLHFLPFILVSCVSLFYGHIRSEGTIAFLHAHPRFAAISFWILTVVQFSGYQVVIHRKFLAHQRFIEQEISYKENVSIAWIRFFIIILLVINILFLVNLFAVIHIHNIMGMWKLIAFIFAASIFALGYKGILQKEVFSPDSQKTVMPAPITGSEKKIDQHVINRVHTYMEEKKPYLDPELTLSSLAKQLNMSRGQLSQIINEGMQDNFYNYVNKYRVDQVKIFMNKSEMKNFNLLGIALEAGFKSKSTFNLIFKRFTGLTPTEYKRNLQK